MNFAHQDDDDIDDVWGSDEESHNIGSFESSRDFAAITKDGFRHGKQKTDEAEMQLGFDDGFEKGIRVGQVCGIFYAQCLIEMTREHQRSDRSIDSVSAYNLIKEDLKKVLYDDFDVTREQYGEMIIHLRQIIATRLPHCSAIDLLCSQLECDLNNIHSRSSSNISE